MVEISDGFSCLDTPIQTRGMLQDFSKFEQHLKCLDQSIRKQKTIRYLFYKITTVVIFLLTDAA